MKYVVKYARHHASMERHFDTKEDALSFAYYTNEYELGFVKEIVNENGLTIMDDEALSDFYAEFNEYIDRYNNDPNMLTPDQHLKKTSEGILDALRKGLEEQEEAE